MITYNPGMEYLVVTTSGKYIQWCSSFDEATKVAKKVAVNNYEDCVYICKEVAKTHISAEVMLARTTPIIVGENDEDEC